VPLQRKIEVRERRREAKALIAARLDTAIEKQLVERLRKGVVRIFFNFSVLFSSILQFLNKSAVNICASFYVEEKTVC